MQLEVLWLNAINALMEAIVPIVLLLLNIYWRIIVDVLQLALNLLILPQLNVFLIVILPIIKDIHKLQNVLIHVRMVII